MSSGALRTDKGGAGGADAADETYCGRSRRPKRSRSLVRTSNEVRLNAADKAEFRTMECCRAWYGGAG